VTVTVPPRAHPQHDRDLERRVAELEALIEEARRRARRRRRIYAAIVLSALGAAAWASFDMGGGGGVSLGRSAAGSPSGLAATASATGRWQPTGGPQGGDVFSLAVDPDSPAVVYAGGWGKVFKSTDGGRRWRDVSHEPWQHVSALAIDPTRPETVYAATDRGIGKSVDGGRHWRMVDAGLFGGDTLLGWGRERWLGGLLVAPSRPRTVYALGFGGLFRTTDGGGRWRFVRPRLGRFWLLSAAAVDPAHPGTVYASWSRYRYRVGSSSLYTTASLYRTTDGGNSWRRIVARGPAPSFTSLAIAPDRPGTIYATDDTGPGVYTSTDGGTTWSVVALPLQAADGLHVVAAGRGTLYATTTSGTVFASTDAGATWRTVGTRGSLAYGTLVVDPRDATTVYDAGDGVAKSVDGGRTWASADTGIVSTVIATLAVDPASPTTLYAGAGGVFESTDGGRSWHAESTGLEGVSIATLAVDPRQPHTIFAGTDSNGLFESRNGGLSWHRVDTGHPVKSVQTVAIDPRHPGTLYVSAWRGGGGPGIFLTSVDGGATWRRITIGSYPDGAGRRRKGSAIQSLAIDPRGGATVFAGTTRGGVYRSTDAGRSWHRVAVAHGGPKAHRGFPNAVTAIAIDPLDPDTVYVGSVNGGIFESTDGGTTWATANRGLASLEIQALVVDPRDPRLLFADTGGGVFRSSNGGVSWQPYGRGLPAGDVASLAVDPAGRTVYAGTWGEGVLSLRLGG